MEQNLKSEMPLIIDIEQIPMKIYNKILTFEQRERLAQGRQTGLIKDIVMNDNSTPVDAKITARVDEKGKLEFTYDYAEKVFKMPEAIMGKMLSAEHKERLHAGELLPIKYKDNNYYVGFDSELNKITIKSTRQIGIPDKINGYNLTEVDKYYLAAGKQTDTHLFKTSEGSFYTANFKMTKDNDGYQFSNIKFVEKENAVDLKTKYNVDKTITDPALMLYPVSLVQNTPTTSIPIEENPKIFSKKIVTSPLENGLNIVDISNSKVVDGMILKLDKDQGNVVKEYSISDTNSEKKTPVYHEIVQYKKVTNTATGFNIEADKYFAPMTLKGVALSEEQRKDLADGNRTLVKGMDIKGNKRDAYVQIKSDGKGMDWEFVDSKKSVTKGLSMVKDDNNLEK